MSAGRIGEVEHVGLQRRSEVHLFKGVGHLDHLRSGDHRTDLMFGAAQGSSHNLDFFCLGGVAHIDGEHEAIQLRFRQGVGAFVLDWVLCCDHHER